MGQSPSTNAQYRLPATQTMTPVSTCQPNPSKLQVSTHKVRHQGVSIYLFDASQHSSSFFTAPYTNGNRVFFHGKRASDPSGGQKKRRHGKDLPPTHTPKITRFSSNSASREIPHGQHTGLDVKTFYPSLTLQTQRKRTVVLRSARPRISPTHTPSHPCIHILHTCPTSSHVRTTPVRGTTMSRRTRQPSHRLQIIPHRSKRTISVLAILKNTNSCLDECNLHLVSIA